MSSKKRERLMEAETIRVEEGFSMRELIDGWRSLKLDLDRRKEEYEKSIEEDKLALANLEGWIKDALQSKGISSVKISGDDVPDYLRGTCYLSPRFSSKLEDPEKFFNYVMETGRTELLFARAADTAVKEYIEAEKVPPPGLSVSVTQKVNFRKS